MIMIAFDTETTGIEPGSRIVQLAAVAFDLEGAHLGEFSMLANPGMPCPGAAAAVHGRTDAELRAAPPLAVVLGRFRDWFHGIEAEHGEKAHLVAHNLPFDASILQWCAKFTGVDLGLDHQPALCTLQMSRAVGQTKRHNLRHLIEEWDLPKRESHEALADAMSCRDLFRRLFGITGITGLPLAGWTEWRYADIPPDCALPNLPEAVAAGDTISFDYIDAKGQMTSRSIIPHGWGEKHGALRFNGHCLLRDESRTFLMSGVAAEIGRRAEA